MPRPTKWSPDVQERICQAIALGATYDLACKYGGVHVDTFAQWRKTKPGFSAAIENAEASAVVGWLAKIEQAAADGTWQAAAWKLERRHPDAYGRTVQQVEHSGPAGAPIPLAMKVQIVDDRAAG